MLVPNTHLSKSWQFEFSETSFSTSQISIKKNPKLKTKACFSLVKKMLFWKKADSVPAYFRVLLTSISAKGESGHFVLFFLQLCNNKRHFRGTDKTLKRLH